MPSLLYLSLMRFPTEKAHGLQIVQNCEAFAQQGWEVTLWVTDRRNTAAMSAIADVYAHYGVEPQFRSERLGVIDLMNRVPRWLERAAFHLVQLTFLLSVGWRVRGRQADLYYTRDEAIALLLTWLVPRARVAYEAHLFRSGRLGAWLQRTVCRRVGSVVAITPLLARDLAAHRGASASRVLAAHDGVRAERFAHLPTRAEARERLGWPAEAFVVGFVGRLTMLDMDKGVSTLVQALADVPGCVLCLVGGPDDIAEVYRRQWIALGLPAADFWYAGSVPPAQVAMLMAAFDVCAMPHPHTPQYARYTSPLKLFEYMASGTAVVASDLPGWADVLRDSENALCVPPDDANALAAAVQRLKEDPALRQRLGVAARAQALRHHTWAARAQAILAHVQAAG